MELKERSAENINIAYIGGGSRGWAWGLMTDLALEGQLSGNIRLYDIDFNAACDNELIGNSLAGYENAPGKWSYKAVKTLEEALTGSDFIVVSILPGTLKEMESDVHTPEKYGIYQPVGDSTGPGGLIRALRSIPIFAEIAEAVKKFSPEAWVLNYTNPMTLCTRALYSAFPEIKAFGCCHEVFGTQHLLAKMLKDLKGIEGIARNEIRVNVLGINHFTWIDKALYKDLDLFPLYEEFSAKYHKQGFEGPPDDDEIYFSSGERIKFDLFRRYGLIAAAGDRHLAEFCPPWYLKDPARVKDWKFRLTPVSHRVRIQEERLIRAKRLVYGEERLQLKHTGEEGVHQIKALLGLGDLLTNVNLPNYGQIQGLPSGCVVETNAFFSNNSITPVLAGCLPDDVNSLVLRHVTNQETTLRASLAKNRQLAFRAFANDPLVSIGIEDARELFNKMLENTKDYLPGWDI